MHMCIDTCIIVIKPFFISGLNFILQKEVLSVNFTPEDPGELVGGSRFKPVDHFLLPKVSFWVVYIYIMIILNN